MTDSVLQLVFKAQNLVSREVDAIKASVRSLNAELDKIDPKGPESAADGFDDMAEAAERAKKEADEAAKSTKKVGDEATKAGKGGGFFAGLLRGLRQVDEEGKETTTTLKRLGSMRFDGLGGALTSLVSGISLYELNQAGVQLSKSVGEISAIVPETSRSFDQLREDVLSLSDAYGGSVQNNAKALYSIISSGTEAGVDANEIFAQSAQLAKASVSDVAGAADLLTTVLNSYGMEASQAQEVSDSLFRTVVDGKTEIPELARSFGQVASTAAAAKVPLKELNAAIAVLTVGGVQTESAIAGLRAAISGILRPTEELQAIFKNAGFESAQAAIAQRGFKHALDLVAASAQGDIGKLTTLVGSIEAVNVILGVTGEKSKAFAEAIESQANAMGSTAEAAGKVAESTGDRYQMALDRIGTSLADIGEGIAKTLTPVLEWFADVLLAVRGWAEENPKLAATIGVVTAAVAGLLVVVGAVGLVLPTLVTGFTALGGPAIVGGIIGLAKTLGGIALILNDISRAAGVATGAAGVLATALSRVFLVTAVATSIYTLYQLAEAAWDAYEATSALNKQQEAARSRTAKYEEEARGLDTATKSKAEFIAMTDEEIDKYQEQLLALQKLSAARKVEEILKGKEGNAALVAKYTAEEEKYADAIAESAAEETRRREAAKQSALGVQEVKKAYVETTAAAEAYALKANTLNQIKFDGTIDALARVRDAQIAAYTLAGNEEGILAAQRTFDQKRLQAQNEYSQKSLAIVNTTLQRKIAALQTEETDAAKRAEKITALEQAAAQQRVTIVQNEMAQVKSARDAAFSAYQNSLQTIASLTQRIADIRMQGEFQVSDIQRSALSDSEAYYSRQQELAATTAKVKEAIAAGEFERAEAYAQRQMQLAQSLNQEVKEGEQVVVSKEQASRNAVNATRQANENLITVLEARKKKAEDEAAAQKATYQQLNQSLDNLSKKLEGLTSGTESSVKLVADDTELEAEFTRVENTETSTSIVFAPNTTAADAARILQQQPIMVPVVYVPQNSVQGRATGGPLNVPRFAVGGSLNRVRARRAQGYMRGPGTGTSDSILFMGSNGEYVLRARAVRKYGKNALDQMNRLAVPTASLPRRATGGSLGSIGRMSYTPSVAAGQGDVTRLNLTINNKELGTVVGPRETIQGLADMLTELSKGTF